MGEKGLPLVERAFATGHPELQMQAVYAAGWVGEKGLLLLKRKLKSADLDKKVRSKIMQQIKELQE